MKGVPDASDAASRANAKPKEKPYKLSVVEPHTREIGIKNKSGDILHSLRPKHT
jgi:hypothetical protein